MYIILMYNYPMHKVIVFLLSFFLLSTFYFRLSTPIYAQGAVWSGNCVKSMNVPGSGPTDVPTIQGFECLFANVLKVIVTIAGLAFLIMFIVGGFQYMQTSNDPKAVAAASSTLTYAIIGLVGVIVSWLILSFIKTFTGVDVTKFQIPG